MNIFLIKFIMKFLNLYQNYLKLFKFIKYILFCIAILKKVINIVYSKN
jgi:hypothetical protein